MTLTRASIAEHIMHTLGLQKGCAHEFVDDFFDLIMTSLEQGQEVKLTGFGNFVVKLKKARPGRNPRTGKYVTINSRKVVNFRAGAKLRSLLANHSELTLEEDQSYRNRDFEIEVDIEEVEQKHAEPLEGAQFESKFDFSEALEQAARDYGYSTSDLSFLEQMRHKSLQSSNGQELFAQRDLLEFEREHTREESGDYDESEQFKLNLSDHQSSEAEIVASVNAITHALRAAHERVGQSKIKGEASGDKGSKNRSSANENLRRKEWS